MKSVQQINDNRMSGFSFPLPFFLVFAMFFLLISGIFKSTSAQVYHPHDKLKFAINLMAELETIDKYCKDKDCSAQKLKSIIKDTDIPCDEYGNLLLTIKMKEEVNFGLKSLRYKILKKISEKEYEISITYSNLQAIATDPSIILVTMTDPSPDNDK